MSAYGHHHFQPGPGPAPYPGAKAFRPEPTAAGRVAFVIAWVFAGLAILFSLLVVLFVLGFVGPFLLQGNEIEAAVAAFGGLAGLLIMLIVGFVALPPIILAVVATAQAKAWSGAALGPRAAAWFFAYVAAVVLKLLHVWFASDLLPTGINGVIEWALFVGTMGAYICTIVFMILDASQARRATAGANAGPTYRV